MARRDIIDPTQIFPESAAVDTALSAYERQIFESFLKKQGTEKAQARASNDVAPDSLRYLFAIFH